MVFTGEQSRDSTIETVQLVLLVINIFCIDMSGALDSLETW